jgi:hypothetical protein
MDIEDRARKWVCECLALGDPAGLSLSDALQAAYLAGSAQTQQDYARSEHRFC